MIINHIIKSILFAIAICSFGQISVADTNLIAKQTKTAYLNTDYGLATYKSKLVENNDTGSTLNIGLGTHVGENQRVGIGLRRETGTANFELNSSSIKTLWQDIHITYRWGYFYIGPIIGSVEYTATKEGETLFEATGSGFGGNFGILYPITSKTIFKLDVRSVTISQLVEVDKKEVKIGPRLDIDIGATTDITKRMFDFMFGYRQQTSSVSYLGTSSAELRTTTYLGFQAGVDF